VGVEFSVPGAPRSVSDQIESLARALGNVTALVVPWESTASVLSMAVTAVKIDGWAIEHTNLGTITLTADGEATHVAIVGHPLEDESQAKLANVFAQFARDVQQRFGDGVGDRVGDRPR
jgi:hypothetical protein